LGEVGDEVVGEEDLQSSVVPAVDADVGDEVEFGGAEGEVDRALVVAFEVSVFEEVGAQPVVQGFAFGDGAAVVFPGDMDGGGGRVAEAVGVEVVGGEVEDAVGEKTLTPSPSPALGEGSRIFLFPFSRFGRRG
jgi:hypothetical protein